MLLSFVGSTLFSPIGKEVAHSEMSDAIKIAVLKGTLSHLLDQEVRFNVW